MQTIKSNTDSFGNGLISVGNTTRSSAASRIQKDVDAIGWLGADLQVIGITDLRSFSPEEQRVVPDWLTMYEKTMDGPECRTSDDRRAESLTWYYERQHCPINHTTSAVLFMSYQQDGDRIVIDDAARNAYWGVMKYDEANKAGLFINADAPIIYNPAKADRPLNRYRDRELLALWDRTSDLVLPLPYCSTLRYRFWNSGMGVDLSIMDEKSLQDQQRRHPECFDESADDQTIQHEIDECEAELAYVIKNNVNLRQHPDAYINAKRKETMQWQH